MNAPDHPPHAVPALAAWLTRQAPATATLRLRVADRRFLVKSNAPALVKTLAGYFHDFLGDEGDPDIEVTALEMPAPALGLTFRDWPRDPGKTGRKDAFADTDGGRVIHKVRTGMQFLLGNGQRIAFGPCLDNPNQVINFIVSQFITARLNTGWQLCHAAGVTDGKRGITIAANSGGGKSSLALHLMSRGLSFVSNDRLLLNSVGGRAWMAGVPKCPRINPGTIVNNRDLHDMLPAARMQALTSLPPAELWALEEKYDVDIDRCFGPDRWATEAPLHRVLVLNWSLEGESEIAFRQVDLRARPDLLAAIMKAPGPFHLPRPEAGMAVGTAVAPGPYLDLLDRVPVYEATGRVDFDAAVAFCLDSLPEPEQAPPASVAGAKG